MKKDNFCPLIKKKCIEHKCSWYIQVRGSNPNTGDPVDRWDCVVSWMPMLLIENSQQQRQTGAAVESFRNETVRANQENQQLYVQALQHGVVPMNMEPLDVPIKTLKEGKDIQSNANE
jgi:hypothetical protein